MLIWIIQTIILSFILIFLVHHLIEFFKSTLTVPKVKDLVNMPNQKYENIYSVISNNSNRNNTSNNDMVVEIKNNDNQHDNNDMKSQLKNFLKTQLNSNTSNNSNTFNNSSLDQQTTNIGYLDSMMSQGYSNY